MCLKLEKPETIKAIDDFLEVLEKSDIAYEAMKTAIEKELNAPFRCSEWKL